MPLFFKKKPKEYQIPKGEEKLVKLISFIDEFQSKGSLKNLKKAYAHYLLATGKEGLKGDEKLCFNIMKQLGENKELLHGLFSSVRLKNTMTLQAGIMSLQTEEDEKSRQAINEELISKFKDRMLQFKKMTPPSASFYIIDTLLNTIATMKPDVPEVLKNFSNTLLPIIFGEIPTDTKGNPNHRFIFNATQMIKGYLESDMTLEKKTEETPEQVLQNFFSEFQEADFEEDARTEFNALMQGICKLSNIDDLMGKDVSNKQTKIEARRTECRAAVESLLTLLENQDPSRFQKITAPGQRNLLSNFLFGELGKANTTSDRNNGPLFSGVKFSKPTDNKMPIGFIEEILDENIKKRSEKASLR